MKIFYGIDPGEQWTGFCRLAQHGTRGRFWRADSGVLKNGEDLYRSADLLHAQIESGLKGRKHIVVVEDYVVRPVGHQKFTRAKPIRLIGALEYVTRGIADFKLMAPASPGAQLDLLGLGDRTRHLRGDSRWVHARSAWRILGYYLLREHPDLLRQLGGKGKSGARFAPYATSRPIIQCPLPSPVLTPLPDDLWCPKQIWSI